MGLEAIKDGEALPSPQTTRPNMRACRTARWPRAASISYFHPPRIAQEIARISRHSYVARDAEGRIAPPASDPSLDHVLEQLDWLRVDFSSTSGVRSIAHHRRALLPRWTG